MADAVLEVQLVDVGNRSRRERAGFDAFAVWIHRLAAELEGVPGVIVNRDPLVQHRDPVAVCRRRA